MLGYGDLAIEFAAFRFEALKFLDSDVCLTPSATEVGRFSGLDRGLFMAPILPEFWAASNAPFLMLPPFDDSRLARRAPQPEERVNLYLHTVTSENHCVLSLFYAVAILLAHPPPEPIRFLPCR